MKPEASGLQQRAFERAHELMMAGWNCSQSVLQTLQELLGVPDRGVLKAATGFGGGIGNQGSLCGALAGGVMALGLLYGRTESSQVAEKERTYLLCARWHDRFVEVVGNSNCREILGVDLRDTAARQKYWSNAQNRERCASRTAGTAARLLVALVEEAGIPSATKGRMNRG